MKRQINRRTFLSKSAGGALGAFVLPTTPFGSGNSLAEQFRADNRHQSVQISALNWKGMMKSHDLIWKKLPKDMTEAPHLGNGLIGSMLWMDGTSIRLQVFRADVHDHAGENFGWTAYSRPRYQIGYFLFKPIGAVTGCDLRLDIFNAELAGTVFTTRGTLVLNHFVHRLEDVIYTEVEATGREKPAGWQWYPFEAKVSRGGKPGDKQYGQAYAPYAELKNPPAGIVHREGVTVSVQDLTAGGDFATAWSESESGTATTRHLVAIQNSYPGNTSAGDAIGLIHKAQAKLNAGTEKWREQHREWWNSYYPESFVSFPDTIGQTFYWNNIYRMACCTRPGAGYIDTAGMWNSGGPWPYSTHDFNTQTAHFPVYTANRLHLGQALAESLHQHSDTLIDNVVPAEWQEDSALLPLATAFDLKGKRDGDGRYREMVGCLPWLLNNIWLHYRYTMDRKLLRDTVYPLLRRSINLYRHLLFTGDDGKLHLPPTFSPETGNAADCNFDLALLKWGCIRLKEICGILKVDDPLLPEWDRIMINLADYPVDENGYRIGSDRPAPVRPRP